MLARFRPVFHPAHRSVSRPVFVDPPVFHLQKTGLVTFKTGHINENDQNYID